MGSPESPPRRSREEILSLFKESGAILEGHFRLTSGLHSPHYFQCARVLQYPDRAALLCGEIFEEFHSRKIDAVIAPALGGIVVGQEVARQLHVRSMFAERQDGSMTLRRGFELFRGERILVCEDVVTTGGSVTEVLGLVSRAGATVAGVGAIVDRSDGAVTFPDFFAALTLKSVTYSPESCPLCKQNLPLVKPGSRVA